jgi:uncharacterized membrane protein
MFDVRRRIGFLVISMTKLPQERADRAIALVLRYGSLLATMIMALGLILLFVRGKVTALPQFHRIAVRILFSRLLQFDPAAVTELGILLLLLTPIFRVIVAVLTFALERDYKYVLISLGVLAVVLLSISFAIEG